MNIDEQINKLTLDSLIYRALENASCFDGNKKLYRLNLCTSDINGIKLAFEEAGLVIDVKPVVDAEKGSKEAWLMRVNSENVGVSYSEISEVLRQRELSIATIRSWSNPRTKGLSDWLPKRPGDDPGYYARQNGYGCVRNPKSSEWRKVLEQWNGEA